MSNCSPSATRISSKSTSTCDVNKVPSHRIFVTDETGNELELNECTDFTVRLGEDDPSSKIPDDDSPKSDSVFGRRDNSMTTCQFKFHEAAIYLEEGSDCENPHSPWTGHFLQLFLLRQRRMIYMLDLFASILLLMLGLVERPSLLSMKMSINIHASVELVCLLITIFATLLNIRWHWKNTFWKHKRHLARFSLLAIMLVEVMVILFRQQSHVRITRALRPLFLVDNYYTSGVRRFLRLILESMPPILDIIGLMMFMIIIYSVFGFYLLGPSPNDPGSPYFQDLKSSFVNLFILLTSANYPDIMMPSYSKSFYYSFYFISYLVINLYFFMNLTLTVVYNTFTDIEDKTFKKIFMNKREAAWCAFNLLVSNNSEISYKDFKDLMNIYQPMKGDIEILLMFKDLDKEQSGGLTFDEFTQFYDSLSYNWKVFHPPKKYWYEGENIIIRQIVTGARAIVDEPAFDYIVYSSIGINAILMLIQASLLKDVDGEQQIYNKYVSSTFILIYCSEVTVKLIGFGTRHYFACPWNCFDFFLTFIGVVGGVLMITTNVSIREVILLRLLRFLRLLRIKKRFRDVFGTVVILAPQLASASMVMLMMYYFFAIIGIEIFSEYDLTNCCKNTYFEVYFSLHSENGTSMASEGMYYLNNFTSLPASSVTLFELTAVNNWHIIMEGYAWKVGGWSRLYFIAFYLLTLVILTIVIASILEAFLFRIQYKKILKKEDEVKKMVLTLYVSREELLAVTKPGTISYWFLSKFYRWSSIDEGLVFTGTKRKTNVRPFSMKKTIKLWLYGSAQDVCDNKTCDNVSITSSSKFKSLAMKKRDFLSGRHGTNSSLGSQIKNIFSEKIQWSIIEVGNYPSQKKQIKNMNIEKI